MIERLVASPRVRRLAVRLGADRPVRAWRTRFPSAAAARDRQDNEHLGVLLAALLAPDSNCVDVGGNVGSVIGRIVELAPEGTHHVFEPIPELAASLRARFPRVQVHELALSNVSDEERDFAFVRSRPGYSGFRERRYPGREEIEGIVVRTARLDDVLPAGYAPTFVKIDVEGAELEVMQGAVETMTRHRPVVVFEHGLGASDFYGTRPEHVFDLLVGEVGYRLFDLDGNGPYTREQLATTFAEGRRWNFVARA